MSAVRIARSIGFVLTAAILAVSGTYVVIDLARWEWNRAIISALVMLAALIVLMSMMLFRQLHRIEQRLNTLERRRHDAPDALDALRSTNNSVARRHFRWLERSQDQLGVFIPVLLGAGVLLSLAAYLVERIAGLFAAATLDQQTIRELAPDVPLGSGLIRTAERSSQPTTRRHSVNAVAVMVTVVVSLGAVGVLRELTQTRPKEVTAAGTTSILLDIEQRRQFRPIQVVAEDLWGSCRSRLPGALELTAITQLNAEQVEIVFDRALGHTGRVRITGCLEDLTLDLVRADVLAIESFATDDG